MNLVYNLVNLMSIFFLCPIFFKRCQRRTRTKRYSSIYFRVGLSFSCSVWRERAFCFDCFKWFTGAFSHSKLFTVIREKEGLAYTISSHFDIFSHFMRIYAGIDRKNRTRTMTLMSRQVSDLKRGKFTSEELRLTKK